MSLINQNFEQLAGS